MQPELPVETTTHTKKRRWIIIASISVSVALVALLSVSLLLTHSSIKSEYQNASVTVDKPFEIKLNQRLLTIPLEEIRISPEVKGKWQMDRSFVDGDTLRFIQSEQFIADTNYTVTFNDVKRVSGIEAGLPPVSFTTEKAPGIETVSFDSKVILAADGAFQVVLGSENRGLRDLELETSPKIPLKMSVRDDKIFEWKPEKGLFPQGKELSVKLVDRVSDTTLLEKTVKVAVRPQLSQKPPEVNFGKNDSAILVFKQPIDSESGTIKFSVDGVGQWKNDTTYAFKPASVTQNKTYSYTIPEGLRSKEGGIFEKEQTYYFSTPGIVSVTGISPTGQELSQKQQTIRVAFNQPVDKESAEKSTVVSRGTIQSTSWQGNTLIISATNFGAQQTVRVTVTKGVKPIFGLPSTRGFEASFTTEIPVKKLNVPMYYQQYAQSCEAASVRMALSYKGAGSPNDWSILQRFGYNPRPLDKKNNIWDDPQKQFVGDVKGNQGTGTGWGVYAEPVANAVRSYGLSATVKYGVNVSFVASNIYKGNPVVLWGIWNDSAVQKNWKTPDGRTVSGPVPMHVRLVVGVKGKESNPVGFYIHDPITGPTYWTASYMMHNVQRAGAANQAIAIE